jgi:hypothetical protein
MGAALGGESFRQRQQFFRRRLEGPHLTLDRAVLRVPYARHDRVPLYARAGSCAHRDRRKPIRNFRLPSCRSAPPGVRHRQKNSGNPALPGRCRPMALSGVVWRLRSNCQTGSFAPSMSRPLCRLALRETYHRLPSSFTPRGSETPVENCQELPANKQIPLHSAVRRFISPDRPPNFRCSGRSGIRV